MTHFCEFVPCPNILNHLDPLFGIIPFQNPEEIMLNSHDDAQNRSEDSSKGQESGRQSTRTMVQRRRRSKWIYLVSRSKVSLRGEDIAE
jgi:hypothetical protein